MTEDKLPTVAQLIQRFGSRISSRPCNLCGKTGLYQIADPGFTACLICDTTAESRREAHISEQDAA